MFYGHTQRSVDSWAMEVVAEEDVVQHRKYEVMFDWDHFDLKSKLKKRDFPVVQFDENQTQKELFCTCICILLGNFDEAENGMRQKQVSMKDHKA